MEQTATKNKLRFNTLEDVLTDPRCTEYIRENISEIRQKRWAIAGELKRSSWDVLVEKNMLNATNFKSEFRLINEKKSSLPSTARSFIEHVVIKSLNSTLAFYAELDKDKKQKVFISGPISGFDYEEVKSRFNACAKMLRAEGFEVVNPVEFVPASASWKESMKLCLERLKTCDVIYLLEGYEHSKGASMEYFTAKRMDLQIIFEHEYSKIDRGA